MIHALLDDHETPIRILRKDVVLTSEMYKNAGTTDFLTGLLEKHEKDGLDASRTYLISQFFCSRFKT